ncbi:ABSCISIC ACID-INSENSITIVE 5-like protein 2 [Acorus gramineus]|uniref:ABSCISIC ACID-INSENSITIVE 5-like protein 2 n=1 Tax=Acorus gramineus TaxID=55184 RepID=A0AAV9BLJ1_ACOGR|nr:ABSCISIC ACID-INSENSITIVE 5-like protein 2 [Acorus gramineus]
MGVQTMMSSRGGDRPQYNQTLTRQGSSLYSLTLDEVQNHLGDLAKPISSMNLEELLKSVFVADSQPPLSAADASAVVVDPPVTLTRTLSKKTVDEVWRDIQTTAATRRRYEEEEHERQMTLGEMTLEDFLVKAGIVSDFNTVAAPQVHWMPYATVVSSPSPIVGSSSGGGGQTPGRKRGAMGEEVMERSSERRQRRMIKNRESAARSRARKQAYTNELENKVSRLEEENERLKKQSVFVNFHVSLLVLHHVFCGVHSD